MSANRKANGTKVEGRGKTAQEEALVDLIPLCRDDGNRALWDAAGNTCTPIPMPGRGENISIRKSSIKQADARC